MKKFLFTDIDGVLVPGFISLDFSKHLFKKGIFSKMYYLKQGNLVKQFINKQASLDYTVSEWLNLWGQGIKGFSVELINDEAEHFFEKYKKKVFPSSLTLIEKFHSKGYKVLGVSAGVSEVMGPLGRYLNIDYIFASELNVVGGNYSSEFLTNFQSAFGKKDFVLSFAKENGVSLEKSVAFGDSIQDIQFLSLVGTKVAVNPNSDLISFASNNNMPILTYKNILDEIDNFI